MSTIKVIGHTPPDTDSTCSPIAYAWFLKNVKGLDAQAYIGGKLNKETEFVLNRFNIDTPETLERLGAGDEIVLIDTNNPAEILPGLEDAKLVEIVDHHKLTDITTPDPITITIRPVACVATIIWELMGESVEQVPNEIAGLMLSAILSDTLNFTSPTTTDTDREVAEQISDKIGVNTDELSSEMFAAKSDLTGMSPLDIALADYKVYEYSSGNYLVGVLETTDPSQALAMKAELVDAMKTYKAENNLAGMFLFIVDIINSDSTLVVPDSSEEEVANKAFAAEFSEHQAFLKGIISRKKQIVPEIEKAVS